MKILVYEVYNDLHACEVMNGWKLGWWRWYRERGWKMGREVERIREEKTRKMSFVCVFSFYLHKIIAIN